MLLAEKLLDTLYELEELSPFWKWRSDEFRDNPPRFIRYKMVVSMLKQLGYPVAPEDFVTNPFVRDIPEDDDLPYDLTDFLKVYGTFQRHLDTGDVRMTFLTLYNFRKRLHHALVDDLMVSGIGNVKPGNQIMAQVSERLLTDVSFVDQFLCIVVDPKGLKFDKDLLVKDYGYPKENLEEIDLDWI